MILKDICVRFVHTCEVTRKLSDHTIRAYKTDLSIFCYIIDEQTEVEQIDRKTIKDFVTHLCQTPASMSTNKRRIACIKAMFRWMELEDYIVVNPFHKIELKLKIPRKLPRNIPNTELGILIKQARSELSLTLASASDFNTAYSFNQLSPLVRSKRDLNKLSTVVVLELLISTGIRVGELTAIKDEHIYWHEARIRILGKGQRERYVFLPDQELIELLRSYAAIKAITSPDDSYVLVNSRGKPASTQFVRKLLKTLSSKTDISRKITPHMYRHSAACQLLEADVDIRFVQRLLGHHSISTTELYTHVNDRVLQDKVTRAGVRGGIA
jgi:site-specific recombinase XerD